MSIDKLDQERELVSWRKRRAEQLAPSRTHQVAERSTGQAPFVDNADLVMIVRKFPALGVVRFGTDWFMQDSPQSAGRPR